MSTFNITALRDAVLWVEKESQRPEWAREWKQSTWVDVRTPDLISHYSARYDVAVENVCGTTYCVAGHLANEAGLLLDGHSFFYPNEKKVAAMLGEETCGWSRIGSALLGITFDEGEELFDGTNSAEDVREIAERIAEAHGEIL